MQRLFILLINCALLALLLLGLPAATRAQVVGYQISRAPTEHALLLWGLGLAAAANLLAALFLIKDRKARLLGWEWAGMFATLGLLQYALYRGWVNVNWLKSALEWCQVHL